MRLFTLLLISALGVSGALAQETTATASDTTSAVTLIVHDPVIVSQSPADVTKWGRWQFPSIQRLPDGRLNVRYHAHEDAASAYGLPPRTAVSSDNGLTWTDQEADDNNPWNSLFLTMPNGDLLKQHLLRPADFLQWKDKLPKPLKEGSRVYDAKSFPPELDGFQFDRLLAGATTWTRESDTVNIPGEVRYAAKNAIVRPYLHRILSAPDGTPWSAHYAWRHKDGVLYPDGDAIFLKSPDNGHTWNTVSTIKYEPDLTLDPKGKDRDGYTEPNLGFAPDSSMFTLIRTTGGKAGVGPMYYARSTDGAKTWSKAVVFDNLGVWPAIITLKNGITLASYGRPGLYVRATADPSARHWDDRVTVIPPEHNERGGGTCAYTDMIALNDHEAMLVYSDFAYPAADGTKRKTILVRRIEAVPAKTN